MRKEIGIKNGLQEFYRLSLDRTEVSLQHHYAKAPYGNWYYLESLPAGRHEITVGLNTNDHETFTHHGQPIEATVVLNTP